MNKIIFLYFISLLVTSCAHEGAILNNTPLSISETRKAIVSVMGEPRSVSENGRTLVSNYFDEKQIKITDPSKAQVRWYSKFTVLGDRRPYDIDVQVIKEDLHPADGEDIISEIDIEKSLALSKKLMNVLHQGQDNRNIIDNFRAF